MKISKLALSAYVALIFLSGVAVGIFSYRLYVVSTVNAVAQSPDQFRRHYFDEMERRLHLRPDQITKLNSIFDATKAKFDDLDRERRKAMKPQMDAIRAEHREQVRAMLDPTQQAEYEKILEEHAAAHRRRQQQKQHAN
jgi:hypothetical protein